MKAHEFDRAFDDGEDVSAHLDWSRAAPSQSGDQAGQCGLPGLGGCRPRPARPRLLGVPRQSLIKLWIADRLKNPG